MKRWLEFPERHPRLWRILEILLCAIAFEQVLAQTWQRNLSGILAFTGVLAFNARTLHLNSDDDDWPSPSHKKKGMGELRTRYVLTEPVRRLILENYDGKTETIDTLVRQTGLPRWKILHWARALGLARTKQPDWSERELIYLEQHLTTQSLAQIAKHLGRSKIAVELKAKRMSIRKQAEGYTLCGLCLAFGCDHKKIEKWIQAGWLRGVRRRTERTAAQGDTWYFSDVAVRKLITEHPLEIDPRKADWLWLVDILSGGLGNLEGK